MNIKGKKVLVDISEELEEREKANIKWPRKKLARRAEIRFSRLPSNYDQLFGQLNFSKKGLFTLLSASKRIGKRFDFRCNYYYPKKKGKTEWAPAIEKHEQIEECTFKTQLCFWDTKPYRHFPRR